MIEEEYKKLVQWGLKQGLLSYRYEPPPPPEKRCKVCGKIMLKPGKINPDIHSYCQPYPASK